MTNETFKLPKSKYSAGQRFEARDDKGNWRPCVVEQGSFYSAGPCDGAYIRWADLPAPTPANVSVGGWQPESGLREVQS